MGRPEKEIDGTVVEKLAKLQCTYEEIAAFVGCDKSTIQRRFATVIADAREKGKCSLRRAQWKAARAGNPTMLKFLGMQWLGQSDKQDLNHAGLAALYADPVEKHEDTGVDADGRESSDGVPTPPAN